MAFMKEPKVARGEAPQNPICNLNIKLSDSIMGESGVELDSEATDELRRRFELEKGGAGELISGYFLYESMF